MNNKAINSLNELQADYDSIIDGASMAGAELSRISAQIADILSVVPSLARKLENIRERCRECGAKFDPDNPEAPSECYVEEIKEWTELPCDLSDTEKDANRLVRDLESQLKSQRHKMTAIKKQFQRVILAAVRENISISRHRQKEAELGLVKTETLGIAEPVKAASDEGRISLLREMEHRPTPKKSNLFSIDGEKVHIRFEGRDLPLLDATMGMKYLAYLVNHQGVQFATPLEMENAVRGVQPGLSDTSPEVTTQSAGKLGYETSEETRMDRSHSGYLSQLKYALMEIDGKILEAEASEDHAKYENLEREKTSLVKEIKEQKFLKKRTTRLTPGAKKVKNRLWNAINYAIKTIEDAEGGAALGAHFRKRLKPFRFPYSYDPPLAIPWCD